MERQVRFTNVGEIEELEDLLKNYINEAVEVEKFRLQVKVKEKTELIYPEELQEEFKESPSLKNALEALTPGRQRAYILYFSKAKQSKTRAARIEKYIEHILSGKGLHE